MTDDLAPERAIYAPNEHRLPWPNCLHSRIVRIREAAQTLDIDAVVALCLDLEHDVTLIEHREEWLALRQRPQRGGRIDDDD